MTTRAQHRAFVAAAIGLWLVFVVQALQSAVLLDDWFQLRYWRDHSFGVGSLWAYAHHNYFHYNPRLGEVLLAIVDGSRAIHLIATPLVQLATLPIVFAIAFGRWPRPTLRDLQLLLFVQAMIWLVIPIPGMMYFYRPFATNYVWAFTITLALFVPYRLALAGDAPPPRPWLAPITLVLGWCAGMCNEHTGPTAMVAMAGFVYAAYRMRRLRAWMLAGMVGLYVGYPMLFFAPGQTARYGGIAARATPATLIGERGITGCLRILRDFAHESRLAIFVFVAAVIGYALTQQRERLPRKTLVTAGVLIAASLTIVATLFGSPTATDRVFYASGVLLVAAFAIGADVMFDDRVVRRFVVGACIVVFGYHVVRFVQTSAETAAENHERIARLDDATPGSIAIVPAYDQIERSRWQLGDDFVLYPWLRSYVGGELYDLAGVELEHAGDPAPHVTASPPTPIVPTYRALQSVAGPALLALLADHTLTVNGVYADRRKRPLVLVADGRFVDGSPLDTWAGHFIRIRRATLPAHLVSLHVVACSAVTDVASLDDDDDVTVPVDERFCRGPFTAIACEPERCWLAGWY